MVMLYARRDFIRRMVGLAATIPVAALGVASAAASGRSAPSPLREIHYWAFTGVTHCVGGYVEEQWCCYECFGSTCTPIQYEWRPTNQPC